ncbi:alpha/beta fold hydrolase [Fervidobacterium thailandense]|uniref:AB hydrolase-1 domain-containing protein n=1 Tax=Fervidobacterium thailandense TaxID=1008305 RepID=A0A1E3G1R9_9BACT|nr:alpha/beta hydrolase [Fervidobacterium thailandense]ODN30196.1 hypothetical protein A4H02_06435 [Fervidobacterium thailandense]
MVFKTILLGLLAYFLTLSLNVLKIESQLRVDVQVAEVNQIKIAYKYYKSNVTGEKTFVLLHGFAGSSTDWEFLVKELRNIGHCLLIDIPPFGLSEKKLGFDYSDANLIKTILMLVDKLGVKKFSLIGHSMGGNLAILIASTVPERIEKLVLVSAAYLPLEQDDSELMEILRNGGRSWTANLDDENLSTILNLGLKAYPLIRNVYSNLVPKLDRVRQEHLDKTFVQNIFLPAEVLIKFSKDKIAQEPFEHDLGKISAQTLIIYGSNDNVTPPAIGEYLSKRIKNSRFELIDGEGHLPMFNERFVEIVVKFLRD